MSEPVGAPLNASRPRTMLAVITCISTYGITMGLAIPLLSLILETRGQSSTLIGANAAMASLGTILVSPFVPRLIMRFGPRQFAVSCICAEMVLFLALKVFESLPAWFVLRFLIGASGAGLFIASETWLNQLADDANRGRWMGLYNAIISGTIAVGPLLLIVTGTVGWLPFVAGAAIIAAALVPLRLATEVPEFEDRAAPMGVLALIREAPTIAFGVLLMAVVFMAGSALLPVYGVRTGMSAEASAVLLAIMLAGGVVLQWPVGWLCDRLMSRRMVLILCAACGGLAGAAIPALIQSVVLWPMVFVWGGLALSVYTVVMTMGGDRFRGARLAQAMAAVGVLWGLGSLTGPGVGGLLMDLFGPHALPLSTAAVCLAFAAFAAVRGLRQGQD